jgi:hypothetical protein
MTPLLLHIETPDGHCERNLRAAVTVGRDAECALAFDVPAMSRRHCALEPVHHEIWQVRDLGSRAGTFVNGQAITKPTPLSIGDAITFSPAAVGVRLTVGAGHHRPAKNKGGCVGRIVQVVLTLALLTGAGYAGWLIVERLQEARRPPVVVGDDKPVAADVIEPPAPPLVVPPPKTPAFIATLEEADAAAGNDDLGRALYLLHHVPANDNATATEVYARRTAWLNDLWLQRVRSAAQARRDAEAEQTVALADELDALALGDDAAADRARMRADQAADDAATAQADLDLLGVGAGGTDTSIFADPRAVADNRETAAFSAFARRVLESAHTREGLLPWQ